MLPLGWVAVLLDVGWALAFVFLGAAIVLFPDGRLPSRHWRWPWRIYLAISALWAGGGVVVILAAVVGARALHVLTNLGFYSHNLGDVFAIWHGGLSSFGPLIGSLECDDDVVGEQGGIVGPLDQRVEVVLHHLSLCPHRSSFRPGSFPWPVTRPPSG